MTDLSERESADASVDGGGVLPVAECSSVVPASVSLVRAPSTWLRALLQDLAPHDWVIVAYFFLLFLGVLFGTGPDGALAMRIVLLHVLALAIGLSLTRGALFQRGSFANALLYRLTLFLTVFSSYFELRIILPASTTRAVDGTLFAIDQLVFHYEPALAWDRLVTPGATEWFAFFYFGYFFLLAVHILPFMFLGRNMTILARFATAIFFTFCAAHLLYIVVPGFGPYYYFAGKFSHELTGGTFWGLVKATVADAGAQKDIFPSLHTAAPSTFTLLAFRYRREFRPFRYSWPVVGFATSQIVIATMFLRWHYLIDICAGLALATISVAFADRAVRWDDARRARLGLSPAWTSLTLSRGAKSD